MGVGSVSCGPAFNLIEYVVCGTWICFGPDSTPDIRFRWLLKDYFKYLGYRCEILSSISSSVFCRELWEGSRDWEIQEEPEQRGVEKEQGGAEEEQGWSKWGGAGSVGVRGRAGQRGGAESWTWEQICVCCYETPAHWIRQVNYIFTLTGKYWSYTGNCCSHTGYYNTSQHRLATASLGTRCSGSRPVRLHSHYILKWLKSSFFASDSDVIFDLWWGDWWQMLHLCVCPSVSQVVPVCSSPGTIRETETMSVCLEPVRRSQLSSLSGKLAQQDGRQAGESQVIFNLCLLTLKKMCTLNCDYASSSPLPF